MAWNLCKPGQDELELILELNKDNARTKEIALMNGSLFNKEAPRV